MRVVQSGSRGRHRWQRSGAALCAAAACALVLGGCGLESYTYYYRPGVACDGSSITIIHNSANADASFLGYEVYYHVFKNKGTATSVAQAIYTAASSEKASPSVLQAQLASGSFPGYSEVVFYRITNEDGSDPTPLLKVSEGTRFYIQIKNDSDWTLRIDTTHQQNVIKRSSSFSPARSFAVAENSESAWKAGDCDYTPDAAYSSSTVYLVAFVLGYGFNLGSTGAVYSLPAVIPNGTEYTGIELTQP